MKLHGSITTHQTIDVAENQIIEATINIIRRNYPKFQENYISHQGIWMMAEDVNPHTGCTEYKPGEKPTAEEHNAQEVIQFLRSLSPH